MKIVIKKPNEKQQTIQTVASMFRTLVGGSIKLSEIRQDGSRRLYVVTDEAAKEKGKPENIIICANHFYDVLYGNVLFVAGNIVTGEFFDLSEEEEQYIGRFIETFSMKKG